MNGVSVSFLVCGIVRSSVTQKILQSYPNSRTTYTGCLILQKGAKSWVFSHIFWFCSSKVHTKKKWAESVAKNPMRLPNNLFSNLIMLRILLRISHNRLFSQKVKEPIPPILKSYQPKSQEEHRHVDI